MNRNICRGWCMVWYTLFFVALFFMPTEGAAFQEIRPSETEVDIVCVTDKWALWKTAELDQTTAMHQVRTYTHRFYLQRLSEPTARLVATVPTKNIGFYATVTPEGTVLIGGKVLTWYHPDGTSVTEPEQYRVSALYPDGAVLIERRPEQKPALFYVPFKEDRLDLDSRIQLIPQGVARYSHPPVVRSGNLLVWMQVNLPEEVRDLKMSKRVGDASIYLHDLETGERETVLLDKPLHVSRTITALGGDVVMTSGLIFDLATGEGLNGEETTENRNKRTQLSKVFAMRNGIGYYFEDGALYAIGLTSNDLSATRLSPLVVRDQKPAPRGGRGARTKPRIPRSPLPRWAVADAGIITWNGKAWETQPWLEQLPAQEE